MHWNTEQILWVLVLAALLVLLIVLLGRDRTGRFPWFTAAIALSAVHLIADHLLNGKLTTLAFYWQTYTAVLVESILGILVLIELLRRLKSGISKRDLRTGHTNADAAEESVPWDLIYAADIFSQEFAKVRMRQIFGRLPNTQRRQRNRGRRQIGGRSPAPTQSQP